ncbi:MAG: hypothetical protein QM783_21030 [Phycisphaerales bacterium]
MAIGGIVAFVLIAAFIFPTETKPDWPEFWRIRPLIITPLAGAAGGACNYFIVGWFNQNGWNKAFAYSLSLMVFLIGLWMGIILGLDGTLWN